ncbi:MAG: ferrous iron transport protein B [Clostridia bacterium]|nr:ferrous iron transport protein B [Clostridia bacterium]
MTLKELAIGKTGKIISVGGSGHLRQHLLDMGMIPGVAVTVMKLAPLGDPMEIRLHGYELTLRLSEAEQIVIEPCDDVAAVEEKKPRKKLEHPGLGEGGRYHEKENEHPLPDDTVLTYALMGNQNCGKTTLFNQLTGANQHVGNFPGVTVDRKDGVIRGRENTLVTDLPGIYSMSPFTSEELVSRNFLIQEKPKAIINIIDANNIERNLYLTLQLLEMGMPMVVAVNMMDEIVGNGGHVDVNAMEAMLGVPVVPISAARNEGIDELIRHAVHTAKYQEQPLRNDFCDESDNEGAVHRCIHAVMHLIEDHARRASLPVRFAATKAIEGDEDIINQLKLDDNEKEMLEHIIVQMESERGLDRAAAMAEMRFSFILKLCRDTVVKPRESKEHSRSVKIDKILTGKYTAIPCFLLMMLGVFYLTFNVIGAWLQGLMESGIEAFTAWVADGLAALQVNHIVQSLVVDGILAGVGSMLSFLPIIVVLFFFLSIMEDSGYIARVAFVSDKLLRKIGLSGRSIVPLLIGFGCTVPAVMATRTLPSARDRKMTVMLTPFMSCTAKLPIYAFFVSAFFPKNGGLVMTGLYLAGIAAGILTAFVFKKTLFKGEAVPFVMELPNYRLPAMKNVARLLWDKAKDFLQRAFSVILIATIIIWFLQSFDVRFNYVEDSESSMLAAVAGLLVPLMKPIGLGDWRLCVSLISGFMAKESVVSTIEVLMAGNVAALMTPLMAASMLAFSLLYAPCVAAVAAIKRELGSHWAVGCALFQCALAWVAALAVRLIGLMFGMV